MLVTRMLDVSDVIHDYKSQVLGGTENLDIGSDRIRKVRGQGPEPLSQGC